MKKNLLVKLLFAGIGMFVTILEAGAHVSQGLTSEVHVASDLISITTMVDAPYVVFLAPESSVFDDGKLTEAEAKAIAPHLGEALSTRLIFTNNDLRIAPASTQLASIVPDPVTSEPHSLKITMQYRPTTATQFQNLHFDPNVFFRAADGKKLSIPPDKIDFFMHSVTLVDCGLVHLISARGITTYSTVIHPDCKLQGKPLLVPANPRQRRLTIGDEATTNETISR